MVYTLTSQHVVCFALEEEDDEINQFSYLGCSSDTQTLLSPPQKHGKLSEKPYI